MIGLNGEPTGIVGVWERLPGRPRLLCFALRMSPEAKAQKLLQEASLLSGEEFEVFVAAVLQSHGFVEARITGCVRVALCLSDEGVLPVFLVVFLRT